LKRIRYNSEINSIKGGVMMKMKPFLFSFGAFVGSTAILYGIGYLFHISILMFHYEYINNKTGTSLTVGSLLPIVFGLIFSFVVEKTYKNKEKSI
jgi:hypothetical protein